MTVLPRIIRMQLIMGIFGCLVLLVLGYTAFAGAFFYGVLLMVVNAWWLARRLVKALEMSVDAGQRALYAGAALRFVALIAGLLLGHMLGLHLMFVAAGLFVAQVLVFVAALIGLKNEL